MKILNEQDLATALINKSVQFETHERVPYFLVTSESELEGKLVVENFYTVELMGELYAKMDSTSRGLDGNFIGSEPTYSNVMNVERQAIWAESFELVTVEQIMELRKVEMMDALEYRQYKVEQLEKESKPEAFDFQCELKGKTLDFHIDDTDRIDLIGQMMMGQIEFEVHDVKRENSETFNNEELGVIMTTLAAVTRAHKYPIDAKIKALYELEGEFTKEDVEAIVSAE